MRGPLTDDELTRIQRIATRVAGIVLEERHKELVGRRVSRWRDGHQLSAVLDAADAGVTSATQSVIQLLTTQHTRFFRNRRHFDLAAEHALWVAHQRGRARAWSAGVATGEEAYSLAMATLDIFRPTPHATQPPVEILATDIDHVALSTARAGEYEPELLTDLSSQERERFLTPVPDTPRWRVNDAVRALIRFDALSLADAEWPDEGPFDVIFCCNVLMYLSADHRYAVLERMSRVLPHDGLLFLDPTEYIGRAGELFTTVGQGVYRRSRPRHDSGWRIEAAR